MKKTIYILVLVLSICACKQQAAEFTHLPFKKSTTDRWGLIGVDGKILFENEFENEPSLVVNGLFYVKNINGLYEYYTAEKKPKKIGEEYIDALPFFDEVAPVVRPEKPISFINKQGVEVFELAQYEGVNVTRAYNFYNGLAKFETEKELSGYVNIQGKVVIPPKYTQANTFSEGLATVWENDSTAYVINTKGEKQFDLETRLEGGHFYFPYSDGIMLCGYDIGGIWIRYGINRKGEKIEFPENVLIESSEFQHNHLFYSQTNENEKTFVGVIDTKGEIVIRAKYLGGEGVDVLERYSYRKGFFDKDVICIYDKDKYCLIDYDDNLLCKPKFDKILPFYSKYAFAQERNSFHLIDKKGERVSNEEYEIVSDVSYYNSHYHSSVRSNYFDFTPTIQQLDSLLSDHGIVNFQIGMSLKEVRQRITKANDPKKYKQTKTIEVNLLHRGDVMWDCVLHFNNDIVSPIYGNDWSYWWTGEPTGYQFNDKAEVYAIELRYYNYHQWPIEGIGKRMDKEFKEYMDSNFTQRLGHNDWSRYSMPNTNYSILLPRFSDRIGHNYSFMIVNNNILDGN